MGFLRDALAAAKPLGRQTVTPAIYSAASQSFSPTPTHVPVSRTRRIQAALRTVLTGTGRGTLRGTLRAGIPSNPGLIGAEIASWAAFSPSLMPRTWTATTVVTFTAQVAGHVTGVAVGYGFNQAVRALAASPLGRFALPPRHQRVLAITWHGTMATTTIALWLKSISQQREIGRLVGKDSESSARAQLGATLTANGLYLATRGLTFAANWGYDLIRKNLRPWLPRGVAPVLSGAIVGGTLAASVDLLVVRRTLEKISAKSRYLNTLVLPGRTQPWEPERSGSPWSLEPWHALGAQGRVVVAEGPRARDLAAVAKRDITQVQEPIRIYAGKVNGRSLRAQVELTIRELHRTGAFRRDHLVVHTTTGTGWVPSWSLQAVEFLTLGNCAQVALQYSDLPSPVAWLTDHETPLAAGKALIHRIQQELERMPADDRPKLYVAGESLGGFGGLGAFADAQDMLAGVDGAVWSGTPQFAPIWKELTSSRDANSPHIAPVIDGGRNIRFATRPEELFHSFYGADLGEWEFPRIAFLQHASDPIVWWDYPLAWRRPAWLAERLGRDVLPAMRWFPFVTFWQVLIDGVASVNVPGGHGHRYEQEMLPAWAAVLGVPLDDDLGGAAGMRFARIAKWIKRTQPPRA